MEPNCFGIIKGEQPLVCNGDDRLPRLESSGDLAALNTRHLLRKPVCGLKAPLGLSCPAGTAVLSGSLFGTQKRTYPAEKNFVKAIRPAPHGRALHGKNHTAGILNRHNLPEL